MPKYEITGEPLEETLPADVHSVYFEGIKAYSLVGTEGQIKETTRILSGIYAGAEMTTIGDAQYMGKKLWDGGGMQRTVEDVYFLVVLVKGKPCSN